MTNFNFTNYLVSKNWNLVNGIYYKDNKSIRILKSKKETLMIALNLNPKVKHHHIVTCKIPSSEEFANELFHKTFLP
jgi:hypothetical protein